MCRVGSGTNCAAAYLAGKDAATGEILADATSCAMCRRMIINAGLKKVVIRTGRRDYTVVDVYSWIDQDDSLPAGEQGLTEGEENNAER